jgi:hypothetical protein
MERTRTRVPTPQVTVHNDIQRHAEVTQSTGHSQSLQVFVSLAPPEQALPPFAAVTATLR